MSVTKDDIEKVAHLARLRISQQDISKYASELSSTMALISTMDKVNTDHIPPMAHPLHCTQRLRKDDITTIDQREKFQQLAPSVEAGLYLVPKVIE